MSLFAYVCLVIFEIVVVFHMLYVSYELNRQRTLMNLYNDALKLITKAIEELYKEERKDA